MVDELGGLGDAIARARAMAGLAEDARVAVAGSSSGLFQSIVDDSANQSRTADALRSALAAHVAPELVQFVASLAPVLRDEAVLCTLPFALSVR